LELTLIFDSLESNACLKRLFYRMNLLDAMTNVGTHVQTACATRQRLLESAGEIFAQRGYRGAMVREICRCAEANVASVNYHFGDKRRLYSAVLQHAFEQAMAKYPPDMGLAPSASATQRLHAFVESLLLRTLGTGSPAWLGKLMMREMLEPTDALDELVNRSMGPVFERLRKLVREITGSSDERANFHCSASVVAQCIFFHTARYFISRIYPQQKYSPQDIAALADHVTTFSLAGLGARDGSKFPSSVDNKVKSRPAKRSDDTRKDTHARGR
jgi:AcrR family transcriptional regulator